LRRADRNQIAQALTDDAHKRESGPPGDGIRAAMTTWAGGVFPTLGSDVRGNVGRSISDVPCLGTRFNIGSSFSDVGFRCWR